jgi:hypothetical protein
VARLPRASLRKYPPEANSFDKLARFCEIPRFENKHFTSDTANTPQFGLIAEEVAP